jgi:DNA-directed RNA polymerase subunit H (RpoH/RPB5)
MTDKKLATTIKISEKYSTVLVYETIQEVFKYRGLTPPKKWMEENDFINHIQSQGYIVIKGDDENRKRRFRNRVSEENRKKKAVTYFIIFDIGQMPTKGDDLSKIIAKVTKADENTHILLIFDQEYKIKSPIFKKIAELQSDGSKRAILTIMPLKYTIFLTNIFKHVIVDENEILNADEEKKILASLHCKAIQLPRILITDSICIYLGAELLDIIKTKEKSEASGIKITYRIVIY